jgi:hypothetical protein
MGRVGGVECQEDSVGCVENTDKTVPIVSSRFSWLVCFFQRLQFPH